MRIIFLAVLLGANLVGSLYHHGWVSRVDIVVCAVCAVWLLCESRARAERGK